MIRISCVCGKFRNVQSFTHLRKWDSSQSPISFTFLTDLWGRESNRPTEFRSDQPTLTLSNRC